MDTSVSALVRDYLKKLATTRTSDSVADGADVYAEAKRRRRKLREIIEKITSNGGGLRMADSLSREELYDRDRVRAEAAAAAERETLKRG